jgi:CRP/FNR family cyclic AMP-dependent transcriptional regulator
MPTSADLLAAIPLFGPLDDAERAALARAVEVVRVPAGQAVFDYGDPGDALFVIRSGQVEVFLTDDTGTRIVLETDGPGEFFGEIGLLAPGPRTASAVATRDLEALRVDRGDLEQFLQYHPTAALDLLDIVGQRLRATSEYLRHTASRNVNAQLADTRSAVQKAADTIAAFSGSIPFVLIHVVLFALWVGYNVAARGAFDPYPFQLLTLVVSLEAIFLSTFVLLSQNRQAAKDHIRADIEYEVNLKAELEIAELHRKVDHLNAEVQAALTTHHADLCARLDLLRPVPAIEVTDAPEGRS